MRRGQSRGAERGDEKPKLGRRVARSRAVAGAWPGLWGGAEVVGRGAAVERAESGEKSRAVNEPSLAFGEKGVTWQLEGRGVEEEWPS